MIFAPVFVLFTVFTGFVICRPQDVAFPDDSEGQMRPFSPQTPPSTRTTMTTNMEMTSSTSLSADNVTTTRIPPRDPGNRIVYIVPCECQFTYQYNPVCGTDGQTYGNMGVLQCVRFCGKEVDVYLVGACGRNNG